MSPTTIPTTKSLISIMPSNRDFSQKVIHFENGDLILPEDRSLFEIFSKDYFKELANEINDFDWSSLFTTFGAKESNIEIQSRKIVKKWSKNIFERFSADSMKSIKNQFKMNLINQILQKVNLIFGSGLDELEDLNLAAKKSKNYLNLFEMNFTPPSKKNENFWEKIKFLK